MEKAACWRKVLCRSFHAVTKFYERHIRLERVDATFLGFTLKDIWDLRIRLSTLRIINIITFCRDCSYPGL